MLASRIFLLTDLRNLMFMYTASKPSSQCGLLAWLTYTASKPGSNTQHPSPTQDKKDDELLVVGQEVFFCLQCAVGSMDGSANWRAKNLDIALA